MSRCDQAVCDKFGFISDGSRWRQCSFTGRFVVGGKMLCGAHAKKAAKLAKVRRELTYNSDFIPGGGGGP